MKILMTSETFAPRIGGAEVHIANVIREFNARGHTVTLLTNEPGISEDSSLFKVIRIRWRITNCIKIINELWQQSKNVDIVHAHYAHRLAALAGIIAFIRRKPVVVILHGMGILNPPTRRLKVRLIHSMYRKLAVIFATKIISTSQDLADVAYRYTKKSKVLVIPNGFNESIFNIDKHNAGSSKLKQILTVRRLVPKNGIQYLIEAMPKILDRDPDVRLVIVGDGPLEDRIRKRAEELQVHRSISFEGFKTSAEVAMYLKESNVVIFPSTAESASLSCAEAMAMGKKVVASRVGGLIELLGANSERGYLVKIVPWEESNYNAPESLPESSVTALAESILFALSDSDTRAMMAYSYAHENLSWRSIVEQTLGVFNSCLK